LSCYFDSDFKGLFGSKDPTYSVQLNQEPGIMSSSRNKISMYIGTF